jgi:predicted DsbA family dithiol-disulfide isomerase
MKMKVEIWSDVMCPFCYIGKRRFENALQKFAHKDEIEVIWKSYQLDPSIKTESGKNINQYLAERKGWTLDYARQMNAHVTNMAKEVGLHYDFDKAVVANSFDAHRFSHLAAKYGLGDAAEERLFKAYFTEGKNIADHNTLVQLGLEIGIDASVIKQTLATDVYTYEVLHDINEAEALGLRGVPFFVMNRKFGVSGAQPEEVFLKTLEKSFDDWQQEQQQLALTTTEGEVCKPGGDCD